MPGSVQDLTKKLIKAIDSEGNVLDMDTIVEVVTALENSRVTGEDLKVSRMGKYINMIRRKLADRKLSKRMKNLVKQWQKLLQSPTPNGLGSLSRPSHSPSPLPSPSGDKPAYSEPPTPPQLQKSTIDRRTKIQQMLSKVKTTPQQPQKPVNTAQQTQLTQIQQPIQIPTQTINTAQQAQIQQPTQIPTQTVNTAQQAPLVAAPMQTVTTQLVAQQRKEAHLVPTAQQTQLAPHPLPNCHSHDTTSDHYSTMNSNGKGASPLLTHSSPCHSHRTDGLVVRFPLHLVKLRARHVPPCELPLSLIVSIKRSLLWQQQSPDIHSSNGPDAISENSIRHSPLDSLLQSTAAEEMDNLVKSSPLEPKRLPHESVPGVHGCLGPDGVWYDWTDPIPGDGTSVTVLPYVYIDGWESMEVL